ncbi:wdr3 [Scenedesmus sp. PABB004]|nr:wdr3 [Scenedesmus sp. PABB004]
MVKAYLRYEQAGAWGVIASGANVAFDAGGKHLLTGTLESIALWNLRQGAQVATLSPELASSSTAPRAAAEVTRIAVAPGGHPLAAGYSDGTVRLWDVPSRTCLVTLSGHTGAVTALAFSAGGGLLASGSADTTAILWDVVGEAGLVRLKGHRDAITDLALLHGGAKLVTGSKDGMVKVWDAALQHCCQTVIGFKGEVWALAVDPAERRLVAGCVDSELRVFAIRSPEGARGAGGAGAGGDGGAGSDSDADEGDAERRLAALVAAAAAGGAGAAAGAGAGAAPRRHELLVPMGSVRRLGQERVGAIHFSASGDLLGVMGAGKSLEIFKVRGEAEALRKMKRRRRRKKEKAHKAAKGGDGDAPGGQRDGDDDDAGDDAGADAATAGDELGSLLVVTLRHKARSFAFNAAGHRGCLGQVAVGLANNSVELIDIKDGSYAAAGKLDLPGHRSDVRCLALSSDDAQLLSGSNAGCKLWDAGSGACLGSIDTGYALCCVFAPGNRHALVGTKEGAIQLVDVGAAAVIHSEAAHGGAVWSLALLPDKSGFVSGSADKTIKFWTWAVAGGDDDDEQAAAAAAAKKKKKKKGGDGGEGGGEGGAAAPGARQLRFSETRSLEMADDVLCVRVSPDGRLLAAALLDATIKVYYADSLKFFLSLYGHKLPALTMDISSDSTLLVTGSADKNIKARSPRGAPAARARPRVPGRAPGRPRARAAAASHAAAPSSPQVWGLDFGDCHRSLFAHQDTVTAVAFVRDTHYAFSVSKDRAVKYWDLDRFELLLELPGHHGEVWALALSAYGDIAVTGSHDRSIRRWERTSEPFFVEEEKERRLESLFEADLESQQARAQREGASGALVLGPEGATFGAPGDGGDSGDGGAAAPAGRRTIESVSAADAIVDALDVAAHEAEKEAEHAAALAAAAKGGGGGGAAPKRPPANPLMLGLPADAYVLRAVSGVRANDLEQALLLLPFNDALRLLAWVSGWLAKGAQVELSCRVATLLLRLHHAQLTTTPAARATLVGLHTRLRGAVMGLRDVLGFNIAGLRFLQRATKESAGVEDDAAVLSARRQLLAGGDAALTVALVLLVALGGAGAAGAAGAGGGIPDISGGACARDLERYCVHSADEKGAAAATGPGPGPGAASATGQGPPGAGQGRRRLADAAVAAAAAPERENEAAALELLAARFNVTLPRPLDRAALLDGPRNARCLRRALLHPASFAAGAPYGSEVLLPACAAEVWRFFVALAADSAADLQLLAACAEDAVKHCTATPSTALLPCLARRRPALKRYCAAAVGSRAAAAAGLLAWDQDLAAHCTADARHFCAAELESDERLPAAGNHALGCIRARAARELEAGLVLAGEPAEAVAAAVAAATEAVDDAVTYGARRRSLRGGGAADAGGGDAPPEWAEGRLSRRCAQAMFRRQARAARAARRRRRPRAASPDAVPLPPLPPPAAAAGCRGRSQMLEGEDVRFSYDLSRGCAQELSAFCAGAADALSCLERQADSWELGEECMAAVQESQLLRAADARLDSRLRELCRADARALCARDAAAAGGLSPSLLLDDWEAPPLAGGNVTMCLRRQASDIESEPCRRHVLAWTKRTFANALLDPPLLQACAANISTHCMNPAEALVCLKGMLGAGLPVAPACGDVLRARLLEAADNYDLLPEVSAACAAERRAFCEGVPPAGVLDCLTDSKDHERFGESCRRARGSLGARCRVRRRRLAGAKAPPSASIPAAAVASECREALTGQLLVAVSDIRLLTSLHRACAPAAAALCPGISPGDGRIIECLQRRADEVDSAPCRRQLLRLQGFAAHDYRLDATLRAVCVRARHAAPGAPARRGRRARAPGPRARAAAAAAPGAQACAADVAAHCAHVVPGDGRVHTCLRSHEAALSPACLAKAQEAEAREHGEVSINPVIREACGPSISSLCGALSGRSIAQLAPCLARHAADDALPARCRVALAGALARRRQKITLQPALRKACGGDVSRLCRGPGAGGGARRARARAARALQQRVGAVQDDAGGGGGGGAADAELVCLAANPAALSAGCKAELAAEAHRQLLLYIPGSPVTAGCDADARKLCGAGSADGAALLQQGGVLGCLASQSGALSPSCWSIISLFDAAQLASANALAAGLGGPLQPGPGAAAAGPDAALVQRLVAERLDAALSSELERYARRAQSSGFLWGVLAAAALAAVAGAGAAAARRGGRAALRVSRAPGGVLVLKDGDATVGFLAHSFVSVLSAQHASIQAALPGGAGGGGRGARPPPRRPADLALQLLLETRVCGSPATEAYTKLNVTCLRASPTARWFAGAASSRAARRALVVHAEVAASYDGIALVWGVGHKADGPQDCAARCWAHRPGPDGAAGGGVFADLPCNAWSFCAAEECFEPDAHHHTRGDCWLKFTEAPAAPEVNQRGALPAAMAARHPGAPRRAQWVSGVLLPPRVALTNGSWSPRADW